MIFKLSLSRIKYLADRVKSVLIDSSGSASVEFSILAIPLFIPLFIFIAQFSHSSDAQDSLRTLARESVRAFVSSSNGLVTCGFRLGENLLVQLIPSYVFAFGVAKCGHSWCVS